MEGSVTTRICSVITAVSVTNWQIELHAQCLIVSILVLLQCIVGQSLPGEQERGEQAAFPRFYQKHKLNADKAAGLTMQINTTCHKPLALELSRCNVPYRKCISGSHLIH